MRGAQSELVVTQGIEMPGVKAGETRMPTMTCAHCNRVVILNPNRTRPRNSCLKCAAYVCDHKVCIEECNPFMQSVELAQRYAGDQAYLLRGPNGELLFDTKLRDSERIY